MDFSIIGVFYIILIRYIWSYSDDLFESLVLFCVVSEIFVELGFIFKIGTWDFSCTRFIEDTLAIYCLIHFYNVTEFFRKKWITLCITFLLPIVLLLLFTPNILVATTKVTWDDILLTGDSPVTPSINIAVITATLRTIMYAFTVVYIYSVFSLDNYKRLVNKLSIICTYFLAIAVLEMFVKDVLHGSEIWGAGIKFIFGETESTIYEARLRGDFYELTLFTKEASHYAYSIFIMMIVKMANNIINNDRMLSLSVIICFGLLYLSTSFTSLIFMGSALIILLTYRWEVVRPSTLRIEVIFLILILVLSLSSIAFFVFQTDWTIGNRLASLIDNYSDIIASDWSYDILDVDESAQIRIISVIQTLIAFADRPLFGYSLNAIACHGATAQFLAGVGVVGLFFWVRHYFFLSPLYNTSEVNKKGYVVCMVLYLTVNLLNSIGLRAFYELTPSIIAICSIFMFAIPRYIEKESINNNYG